MLELKVNINVRRIHRLLPFHITFIVSILKVVHQEHKHGINCFRFYNVLWYRQEHAHLNPHFPYFLQSSELDKLHVNYVINEYSG
jgi:hypothetical protein